MRTLKRLAVAVTVVLLAVGGYALWYVYGAWPVPAGYEFPRHSLWGGGPAALFEGELVVDDGCIRSAEGEGLTMVWPPGYSLHLSDDQVEVHAWAQLSAWASGYGWAAGTTSRPGG